MKIIIVEFLYYYLIYDLLWVIQYYLYTKRVYPERIIPSIIIMTVNKSKLQK
jgi:hypothetical protein